MTRVFATFLKVFLFVLCVITGLAFVGGELTWMVVREAALAGLVAGLVLALVESLK